MSYLLTYYGNRAYRGAYLDILIDTGKQCDQHTRLVALIIAYYLVSSASISQMRSCAYTASGWSVSGPPYTDSFSTKPRANMADLLRSTIGI